MRRSRNAISAPAFHFSLVICRINTITFLSAFGSSCTLVYFLHALKCIFPSSHWDTAVHFTLQGTQDMTLWDRLMCTKWTQQFILMQTEGTWMHLHRVLHTVSMRITVYMFDSHTQRSAALIQSVKSRTCKSPKGLNVKYFFI